MEKELRKLIGKKGAAFIYVELSMRVQVTIQDVRSAFGRIDALVTPVAGDGQKWVSSDRFTFKR